MTRCFGDGDPLYERYHDDEWGRPVRDERGLFEKLSLEAFQSGLSWVTILRKREAFREAFAGFDPAAVAAFGPPDVQRLLADAGIVRNRAKIEATIANAGCHRGAARGRRAAGRADLGAPAGASPCPAHVRRRARDRPRERRAGQAAQAPRLPLRRARRRSTRSCRPAAW